MYWGANLFVILLCFFINTNSYSKEINDAKFIFLNFDNIFYKDDFDEEFKGYFGNIEVFNYGESYDVLSYEKDGFGDGVFVVYNDTCEKNNQEINDLRKGVSKNKRAYLFNLINCSKDDILKKNREQIRSYYQAGFFVSDASEVNGLSKINLLNLVKNFLKRKEEIDKEVLLYYFK